MDEHHIKKAQMIFSSDDFDPAQASNLFNRVRIVDHYVYSHPAAQDLYGFAYRFARDFNPIHFAFERGYQIASGKESVTGKEINRARSGIEFVAALAIPYVGDKTIRSVMNGPTTKSPNIQAPHLYPEKPYHIRVQTEIPVVIRCLDGSEVSVPAHEDAVYRGVRPPEGVSFETYVANIIENGGFPQI